MTAKLFCLVLVFLVAINITVSARADNCWDYHGPVNNCMKIKAKRLLVRMVREAAHARRNKRLVGSLIVFIRTFFYNNLQRLKNAHNLRTCYKNILEAEERRATLILDAVPQNHGNNLFLG